MAETDTGDRFVLYTKPDGRVTKDFARKKRQPISCNLCRKLKKKCDFSLPCRLCESKGRGHLCNYSERSPPADASPPDPPKKPVLPTFSEILEPSTPGLSYVHSPVDSKSAIVLRQEGGATGPISSSYMGPLSWHIDVATTNPRRGLGVERLLNNFEKRKQELALDCVPPWQNYELMQRNVAPHHEGRHCAITSSESGHSCYIDPYLSGIEWTIFSKLVSRYWNVIHPIETILHEKRFWQLFDKFSRSPSENDIKKPLHAFVVWMILAYSSRSLQSSDSLLVEIRSKLRDGKLMFSIESSVQSQLRFVADPCELFLHCADICAANMKIFQKVETVEVLNALILYTSYVHDGSERNWIAWNLLGLVENAAKRLGLHRDPGKMFNSDPPSHEDADHRRILFFTLKTMNSLYSVDLGQLATSWPKKCYDVTEHGLSEYPESSFIIFKYRISEILDRATDTAYPLYTGTPHIEGSLLEDIKAVAAEIDSVWSTLAGTKLALREGGADSKIRLDIALKLENPVPSAKVVLQRYILDTLLHKTRFTLFKPFLKYDRGSSSDVRMFQESCLSSATALLENQFESHNNSQLLDFWKFRWNYLFSHAFQGAVVISLHNKDHVESGSDLDTRVRALRKQLVESSARLYKDIQQPHGGCAASKASLVLSYLLDKHSGEDNHGSIQMVCDPETTCNPVTPNCYDILPHNDKPLNSGVGTPFGLVEFDSIPQDIASLESDFFASILGNLPI